MTQKNKNKTSSFSSRSIDLIKLNKGRLHGICNKLLFCAIIIAMITNIATVNDLSIKGFELQELKNDIAALEIENEHFELKAMTLESFDLIDERAEKLGMVKVKTIDYVSLVDGVVAVK